MTNADPSDPAQDALIRQMRDQIVDNDLKLMLAVNKRLELVAALRRYKESQGLEFVDHSREEWMHRYLQGANRGPLSRRRADGDLRPPAGADETGDGTRRRVAPDRAPLSSRRRSPPASRSPGTP